MRKKPIEIKQFYIRPKHRDLWEWFKAQAKQLGLSESAFITSILKEYKQRIEDKK